MTPGSGSTGPPVARPVPWAVIWGVSTVSSVGLLAVVGALGESAAVPGLGGRTATPPWDLAAHPAGWLVTALAAAGYLAGGLAVLAGLRAVAAGAAPRPARLALAGVAAVALLAVVPPAGSADHLSYVAYGRIAAAGDDPYVEAPGSWRAGTDPVAGAVQPPWRQTPSVYGPVATAVHAAVAVAGGGSLRLTVWCWQLVCAGAFLAVALALDRSARSDPARPDPAARARVAVLWTLNPLLLGQLVLGAHLDVLAAAFAVGGLVLAGRVVTGIAAGAPAATAARPAAAVARPAAAVARPAAAALAAGALLGAAVATKAPYALFALAALWGLRAVPRPAAGRAVALGAVGGLAVLVPAHVWAGAHAFDQLGRASRFTSLATPWRAVANLGDLVLGRGAVNAIAAPTALVLAAALAVLLWRRRIDRLTAPGPVADAARAALALTVAWTLTAPYALPWYDAMVWVPLALVGPSLLDGVLTARLMVLALAYVPGRVVGLTPSVEAVTLGVRTFVAPVLVLGVIVVVVRWGLRGRAGRRSRGRVSA